MKILMQKSMWQPYKKGKTGNNLKFRNVRLVILEHYTLKACNNIFFCDWYTLVYLDGQPSHLLACMHVSNYKATFSPMYLVF